MKIAYLHHNQIDKTKWDACIDRSCQRIVYARSWFLDIVHEGWEALVIDDYKMVMPLTAGKKFGISYLFQPHFTQQLGIFSETELSLVETTTILDAVPKKFRFIDIVLNKGNKLGLKGFETKKNRNYELNLNRPYAELFKGYDSYIRRNLKKAARSEATVTSEVDPAEMVELFRKGRGQDIENLKAAHFHLMLKIIETSLKNGQAEMRGINSDTGKLIAGAFLLRSYNSSILLFSVSDEPSRQIGGMFLILDRFIHEHAGTNYILDFEGSSIPGVAGFYESFGSEEFSFFRIRKNELPWPLNRLKK